MIFGKFGVSIPYGGGVHISCLIYRIASDKAYELFSVCLSRPKGFGLYYIVGIEGISDKSAEYGSLFDHFGGIGICKCKRNACSAG